MTNEEIKIINLIDLDYIFDFNNKCGALFECGRRILEETDYRVVTWGRSRRHNEKYCHEIRIGYIEKEKWTSKRKCKDEVKTIILYGCDFAGMKRIEMMNKMLNKNK